MKEENVLYQVELIFSDNLTLKELLVELLIEKAAQK